jgi:uncharacterized membrane protein YdjX (TVP38/TMEM64 family)
MKPDKRILLLIVLAGIVIGFYAFDLGQFLDLAYFKQQHSLLVDYRNSYPIRSVAVFFAVYIMVTSASLPGAGILAIAAGSIFGVVWGTIIASFASAIGGSFALLLIRYLFRDIVQYLFAAKLAIVNRRIEQDGAFYLFTLRFIPVFPYFVINLLMALTPIRVTTFYWVTQVGMLAGLAVLVNAGTEIAKINGLADIFSPGLIFSLCLLGIFPLFARLCVRFLKARYAGQSRITQDLHG